jgi:hypothetical protein
VYDRRPGSGSPDATSGGSPGYRVAGCPDAPPERRRGTELPGLGELPPGENLRQLGLATDARNRFHAALRYGPARSWAFPETSQGSRGGATGNSCGAPPELFRALMRTSWPRASGDLAERAARAAAAAEVARSNLAPSDSAFLRRLFLGRVQPTGPGVSGWFSG